MGKRPRLESQCQARRIFCEKLPAKRTLDFLGVNYYTRDFIRFDGLLGFRQFGEVCAKDHHREEAGEQNDLGWEIFPRGIGERDP